MVILFYFSSFVPFLILKLFERFFSNQIFIIMSIFILVSIPAYLNTFSSSYSLFLLHIKNYLPKNYSEINLNNF